MIWYSDKDYEELLEERHNVLLWEDFGSYQGDYVALVGNESRLGLAIIGYGSCSGCDALEGCKSEGDVVDLMDSIERDIFWGTKTEILAYLNDENRIRWWTSGFMEERNAYGIKRLLDFLKDEN